MSITITDTAVNEVQRIIDSQNLNEDTYLRLGIAGGGCSGMQYSLGFDTDYDPAKDAKYDQEGFALVTDKKFDLHLEGTTIDFIDGPTGQGFSITNPNIPQGGGCPGCGGH
jgi:iron-sulfur cluster assembly protein